MRVQNRANVCPKCVLRGIQDALEARFAVELIFGDVLGRFGVPEWVMLLSKMLVFLCLYICFSFVFGSVFGASVSYNALFVWLRVKKTQKLNTQ